MKSYLSVILVSILLGLGWDCRLFFLAVLIPKNIAIHMNLGPYNWGEEQCICGCGYRREQQRNKWRQDSLVGLSESSIVVKYGKARNVVYGINKGHLPEADETWYYSAKNKTTPWGIMFKNNICIGAARGEVHYTFH